MEKDRQSAGKTEEEFEFVDISEYSYKTGKKHRVNIPVGGRDYVTCQICKRKFTWLELHLKEKHCITKQEYHRKFGPQWKTICDVSREKLKEMEERFKKIHSSSASSETNMPDLSKKKE